MWKKAASIAVLTLAMTAPVSLPAGAEQHGQRGRPSQVGKAKGHDDQRGRRHTVRPPDGRRRGQVRSWTHEWNREQRARLTPMLPPGMTLEQAATGFRTRGEFISALNASYEHSVSFVQLKHLMIVQGMSLGQALQTIRR